MLVVSHGILARPMTLPGWLGSHTSLKWHGTGVWTQEPVVTHEYMSI